MLGQYRPASVIAMIARTALSCILGLLRNTGPPEEVIGPPLPSEENVVRAGHPHTHPNT